MPKESVLILGSGPIQIGQAGEFDYAGAQALKACKEEGLRTLLLNPNVASVQTRPEFADRVFAWPLDLQSVKDIVALEQPAAYLASFGGQSALNLALEIDQCPALATLKCLGTALESVRQSEDRQRFAETCTALGLSVPRRFCFDSQAALKAALPDLVFPLVYRADYALGGLNARRWDKAKAEAALNSAKTLWPLVLEEDLTGWKEIEYEVMRDQSGDVLVVCALENIDPMGIHTGDSYVVAPPQSLSQSDYFRLRAAAITLVEALHLIGECNVQFALHPTGQDFRVIELNPRLSRSSALASKATGYPIAYCAAKLALGKTLREIPNPITRQSHCFFEPALDYVVLKAPRWDFSPFDQVDRRLGLQMKSIGETMGIGSDFQEALSKIWPHNHDFDGVSLSFEDLRHALKEPDDLRLLVLAEALRRHIALSDLNRWTGIAPWFLEQIRQWVLNQKSPQKEDVGVLRQIDTLAGEMPAQTPYLYFTEQSDYEEYDFAGNNWVILPGSGPYGIGSSLEFDFCCVSAVRALQQAGYRLVVVNQNPETVSTDYDLPDVLICEAANLNNLRAVMEKSQACGVLLSCSGQLPHQLLPDLPADWPYWGTPRSQILRAENRLHFAQSLQAHGIAQAPWCQPRDLEQLQTFASEQGYPLIYRPGFVLGGQQMQVLHDRHSLAQLKVFSDSALVNRLLEQAQEFELDAVALHGEIQCYAFSENLQVGGIHSGDSWHQFPVQTLSNRVLKTALEMAQKVCQIFAVSGPFNLQYLWHQQQIYVIEANLRASRNIPFLTQMTGVNLVEEAMCYLCGQKETGAPRELTTDRVGLRLPVFSWARLPGATQELGVKMQSTGEACLSAEDHEQLHFLVQRFFQKLA